jgi:hypothetical protein
MARKRNQDEDPSDENVNNTNDDTFGLPEIEYEPLKREETPKTSPESASYTTSQPNQTAREMEREDIQNNEYNSNTNTNYYEDEDSNSPWPKILGIAALLVAVGIGIWYFGFYRPEQARLADKAKQEQEAEAERRRIADLAESRRLEKERRTADSLAALNSSSAVPGQIDTLTERTGRYYVIVASGVDGDLILDYAKTLAPKGLSPKIIPPHGKVKFYRLAIDQGDTYAATQARADELKSEYTGGAWVVKY